jgi:hypothetical protein
MPALVREELQTLLAARPDALLAIIRDELAAKSDAMPALVRDELQTLLAARPDALLAIVREELAAKSDAMPALVRDELEKLLAGRPDSLLATVRHELTAMSDTMRLMVRDELQKLLPAEPEVLLAKVGDELQALPGLDRNDAVRSCGGFLGYNLFQRRDEAIAVPRSLGPIDPADLRERPGVIVARGPNAARLAVMWRWVRWAYWDGAGS